MYIVKKNLHMNLPYSADCVGEWKLPDCAEVLIVFLFRNCDRIN